MLVRALEDHALPCLMKDGDTPRDGGDNPIPLWKTALSEYAKAVNILRHIPTSTEKIMGEEGYKVQLNLSREKSVIQLNQRDQLANPSKPKNSPFGPEFGLLFGPEGKSPSGDAPVVACSGKL